MDFDYVCAFPLDGATDARTDQGCGRRTDDDTHRSAPCQSIGILTAEQWLNSHQPHNSSIGFRACGFSVGDHANPPQGTASAFQQVIRAMNQLGPVSLGQQNEMRAATWAQGIGDKLPIESFFYLADAGDQALLDARGGWTTHPGSPHLSLACRAEKKTPGAAALPAFVVNAPGPAGAAGPAPCAARHGPRPPR